MLLLQSDVNFKYMTFPHTLLCNVLYTKVLVNCPLHNTECFKVRLMTPIPFNHTYKKIMIMISYNRNKCEYKYSTKCDTPQYRLLFLSSASREGSRRAHLPPCPEVVPPRTSYS